MTIGRRVWPLLCSRQIDRQTELLTFEVESSSRSTNEIKTTLPPTAFPVLEFVCIDLSVEYDKC